MNTIDKLRAAFTRLKINEPEVVARGSKVNVNSVVKEAGLTVGTVSKTKHKELYDEINEYKDKLNKIKLQDESLKSDSQESRLKDQLRSEKKLRAKYYKDLQEEKSKLTRQRAKESMVLQAMFDLLDNDDKEAILRAGIDKKTNKVLKFTDIKKAKVR